jgi:hypothetical protein
VFSFQLSLRDPRPKSPVDIASVPYHVGIVVSVHEDSRDAVVVGQRTRVVHMTLILRVAIAEDDEPGGSAGSNTLGKGVVHVEFEMVWKEVCFCMGSCCRGPVDPAAAEVGVAVSWLSIEASSVMGSLGSFLHHQVRYTSCISLHRSEQLL